MKALIVLFIGLALGGCAHAPVAGDGESLLADALFPAPSQPVNGDDVFALSDSMRDYLATRIAERIRAKGPRLGLVDAMRDDVRIEYDSAMTRNAAQAFEARSGNCLSLVIVTAAFARQLGIPVGYQRVHGQDTWTRSGGLAFRSTHVNVVLGSRTPGRGESIRYLVVDFLPPEVATHLSATTIPEEMVVAMYLNNRAAEALAEGDLAGAYWWARAAIKTSPSFLATYNTLGVIYLRHGDLPEAERAFTAALEREPESAEVLSNLSRALVRQGRLTEAQVLRQRLAEVRPYPPFHFLDEGMAAMGRGDNESALELFKKELARMPYDDEVHFAIAVANLRLGDMRRARRHLTVAVENSTTRSRREVYAAKLEYLRALQSR